jgi:hypothetical protein
LATCEGLGFVKNNLVCKAEFNLILPEAIKKYKLPIVAIGMGEKETDLHPFNAEYFSKALLGIED